MYKNPIEWQKYSPFLKLQLDSSNLYFPATLSSKTAYIVCIELAFELRQSQQIKMQSSQSFLLKTFLHFSGHYAIALIFVVELTDDTIFDYLDDHQLSRL